MSDPVFSLHGAGVALRAMDVCHASHLLTAASDGELWKLRTTPVPDANGIDRYIAHALEGRTQRHVLPFVTSLRESGEIVGTSRLWQISREHRRCELGYTWIAQRWQRTFVNAEAKYLMLRYAFEHLGLIRVQFKTDVLNVASRGALTKLGAHEEGILRNERIMADGRVRDSVLFSIVASEWPAVRVQLEARLVAQGITPAFSIESEVA